MLLCRNNSMNTVIFRPCNQHQFVAAADRRLEVCLTRRSVPQTLFGNRGKLIYPAVAWHANEWTAHRFGFDRNWVRAFTAGCLCWEVTHPIALIRPIIRQRQPDRRPRPALRKTDIMLIVWGGGYIKQPGTGVILELKKKPLSPCVQPN